MHTAYYHSPIGSILITASPKGIRSIQFVEQPKADVLHKENPPLKTLAPRHLQQCLDQIDQYFSANLTIFNLPLDLIGTPFQQKVWAALLSIPFGRKVSYLHIAQQIDKPKGSQAVGNANGKNPVAIVVPCHRVIGKNGSLVGYAGGLKRKKWLLELESGGIQGELF